VSHNELERFREQVFGHMVDERPEFRRGVLAGGPHRAERPGVFKVLGFSAVTGGRGALPGGTLPSHQTKTVALDAQQIQQLLISTMKDRPVHLGLYAFALLLQLCPSHLVVSAIGARLSPTKASAVPTRGAFANTLGRHSAFRSFVTGYREVPCFSTCAEGVVPRSRSSSGSNTILS
jgi:hypothetical protein